MRCYLLLFVCLQSNMVTKALSEGFNSQTTFLPPDANEDLNMNTDFQFVTETSTEIATTDLTTEGQLTTDETIGFTKVTDVTDFPSSTVPSTSEFEERSTFLWPGDQTVSPENIRSTQLDEEVATEIETSGKFDTSQNSENTDTTKITEQMEQTELTTQQISSVTDIDSNVTVSLSFDQSTRQEDSSSWVDFGPENSSRIPEATTLVIDESQFSSVPINKVKILCKTIEDCSSDLLCVFISNSCECVTKWESEERNLTQCERELVQPRSNTTLGKENEEIGKNGPFGYRKLFNLSPRERIGSVVTLAFAPSIDIVEWFQKYDGIFKTFLASRLAIAWDKLNNETVRFPNARNNILYVTPSPFQNENEIVISFLVQNPFADSSDVFLHSEDILDCIRVEWDELETQLNLNVSYMKIGFPFEALQQCGSKVLGNLDQSEVKLLFLGMLVLSTCSLLAAIVAITVQCRARRSRFIDLSAIRRLPYGHPAAVLVRSPGDGTISGRDLASDQQCKEEELDREHWMASHSQRGDERKEDRAEKTVMVEIQGPKKPVNSETPF